MIEDGAGRFEISSVTSRTFDAIGGNVALFIGLALILAGLPAGLINWWQLSSIAVIGQYNPGGMFTSAYWGPMALGWLVSMVSGAVLQAALTRATVMHLSGEKPGFGPSLTVGLSMILPMIAIGFIVAFGVGIAMLLLIVPGIILWLCWSVVVPVYVQEKVGIFEAFSRSMALTQGARWKIFLTMLVVVIGLWLLSIPVGMMTLAVTAAGTPLLIMALLTGMIGAIGNMVFVTVQSCIYVELRSVKEGVAPADLEAIFA